MSQRYKTIDEFVEDRTDLYAQGRNSFEWRYRVNRRRYIESGAVLMIGDRRMIDPQACERLELDLAREAGQALLRREEAGA